MVLTFSRCDSSMNFSIILKLVDQVNMIILVLTHARDKNYTKIFSSQAIVKTRNYILSTKVGLQLQFHVASPGYLSIGAIEPFIFYPEFANAVLYAPHLSEAVEHYVECNPDKRRLLCHS
jgi:hypothetical protein